jgi:Glycosyltransferases involved in cell wall biogenesis
MKLVAVTVVENEADVVEAFVRHTCALVDAVLVCDRGSVEGTREVAVALASEGLPVRVFSGEGSEEDWARLREVAVAECGADWVLALRADEIVVAESREALERVLRGEAVRVRAREYAATLEDGAGERNPVTGIGWRKKKEGRAERAWRSRSAGERAEERDVSMDEGVWVARFGLRSAVRAAVDVVRGELTKLGAGAAREGLDTHFRLGFQLLMEEPRRFAATVLPRRERLEHAPVVYRGGALRYLEFGDEATRGTRLLLPLVEGLARELGRQRDGGAGSEAGRQEGWREIDPREMGRLKRGGFAGFEAGGGWERLEGPYAPGFLPEFRWTRAPEAVAIVRAEAEKDVGIEAEMLTYAERQVTTVVLNGVELARVEFARVNEKQVVRVRGRLEAGENRLVFRHRTWIEGAGDPRKLAVIFLGLRVE